MGSGIDFKHLVEEFKTFHLLSASFLWEVASSQESSERPICPHQIPERCVK